MGLLTSEQEKQYPRIAYMLDYLFQQQFDLRYELTISLSTEHMELYPAGCEKKLCIPMSGFLMQSTIESSFKEWFMDFADQRIEVTEDGGLNFDVLAAQFFLLSRYEEYLTFEADSFGRYQAKNSSLFKKGLLQVPLVDRWTMDFMNWWNQIFPQHRIQLRNVHEENLLTIDIDKAYAIKYASPFHLGRTLIKSLVHGSISEAWWKWRVWFGKEQDPFDQFDHITKLNERYGLEPKVFVLCGESKGYDQNLGLEIEHIRQAIFSLAKPSSIGIHPSIRSTTSFMVLSEELDYLARHLGQKPGMSRQHFLKLSLPQSYDWLCELGIKEDYTMGFAEVPGFRAGTSKAFYWFQLKDNKSTPLKVVPFSVMDTTLCDYMALSCEEAVQQVKLIKDEAIKYGGRLGVLLHQESPGGYGRWKGWQNFYEEVLKLISE